MTCYSNNKSNDKDHLVMCLPFLYTFVVTLTLIGDSECQKRLSDDRSLYV